MTKRKRSEVSQDDRQGLSLADAVETPTVKKINGLKKSADASLARKDWTTIQIVTGSYEKVLHGITVNIPQSLGNEQPEDLVFSDTFLFTAHTSAIRCLALSPPSSAKTPNQSSKIILASGGNDERINLYHLSASPAPQNPDDKTPVLPALTGNQVWENPKNRELGALLHHTSSVTALHFPSRAKLLSSGEDNVVAITRTRDWTVLSTVKAPNPVAHGRPSGDTAPPGVAPAGINDFAVHPSAKLMLSVGKGERCMRLWDLVRGKKAGVLNFDRELLRGLGEGKKSSGEGRKVRWNEEGTQFTVVFERGAVVFGIDSKPLGRLLCSPSTKFHQIQKFSICCPMPDAPSSETVDVGPLNVAAISTEDGRVLFFSTESAKRTLATEEKIDGIPGYEHIGEIGGKSMDLTVRVKDFQILKTPQDDNKHLAEYNYFVVTGGSDGTVRIWKLDTHTLGAATVNAHLSQSLPCTIPSTENGAGKKPVPQVGSLLGTYDTANRITCLVAFVMSSPQSELNDVPKKDTADLLQDEAAEVGWQGIEE